MNYRMIRVRNLISAVVPGLVALLERLRIAFRFLPKLGTDGFSLPLPYLYKRGMIARTAQRFGARALVETGTYMGDTPWMLRKRFERIWTIEVHPPLAALARQRFRRHRHITAIEGDSAQVLATLVPQVQAPVLFWLDGHYSFGITGQGAEVCPIFAELDAVFGQCAHPFVVMIDDARLFGSEDGYPSLQALVDYLEALPEPPLAWLENDVIFLLPRQHPQAAAVAALPLPARRSPFYA